MADNWIDKAYLEELQQGCTIPMNEFIYWRSNERYKEGQYIEALEIFTSSKTESPSYYGSRLEFYNKLHQKVAALEKPRQAYIQIAKCCVALGDLDELDKAVNQVKNFECTGNDVYIEEKALIALRQIESEYVKAYEERDYEEAIRCMERAADYSPSCNRYKIQKADCLALLCNYQDALKIAEEIIAIDGNNVDAKYVRGVCLYNQDTIDNACQRLNDFLKLAPDHQRALIDFKKVTALKEGIQFFTIGEVEEARKSYTKALKFDPQNTNFNFEIYYNRACVFAKLNENKDAIEDCAKAIGPNEKDAQLFQKRACFYMNIKEWAKATDDFVKACYLNKNIIGAFTNIVYGLYAAVHQNQNITPTRIEEKAYYQILGIKKNASDVEMRTAYIKRALAHHPDRHVTASDDVKKEQEKKFKEVGEAYAVLSDPENRVRYDNGQGS